MPKQTNEEYLNELYDLEEQGCLAGKIQKKPKIDEESEVNRDSESPESIQGGLQFDNFQIPNQSELPEIGSRI